ncbi:MAG: hypothetical protein NZT92_14835 [Abditibacteriales bacterium]|nr:hypothetical protein [Abditibacteriales bacterium]
MTQNSPQVHPFESAVCDLVNVAEGDIAPARKVVDSILQQAILDRADMIGIEREDDKSVVWFRIRGVVYQIALLPQAVHTYLIERLRRMAGLKDNREQRADVTIVVEAKRYKIQLAIFTTLAGDMAVIYLQPLEQ